jgi:tetratricopeptide (TPR) repeat protein
MMILAKLDYDDALYVSEKDLRQGAIIAFLCTISLLFVTSSNCNAADQTPSDSCALSLAQGPADEAVVNCSRAIEANPMDASSYSNRGAAFLRLKNFSDALRDLETAAKLDDRNPKTFYNLGVYFDMMQLYEKAVEQYTVTIKLSPGNPVAYFNRANDLKKLCKSDEARRDYKKIMEIAPYMARIWEIPTSIDNDCPNNSRA